MEIAEKVRSVGVAICNRKEQGAPPGAQTHPLLFGRARQLRSTQSQHGWLSHTWTSEIISNRDAAEIIEIELLRHCVN